MKLNIKNINIITKNKKYIILAVSVFIILLIGLIIIKNTRYNLDKIFSIDEIVGKTAKSKYVKVQDHNGEIFYLPKGFKISTEISEQTVKDGVVIIDDTGDKETAGSEFVWIPVNNSDEKLFEQTFTNNIKRTSKTLDNNLLKENIDTKEYQKMKNSIYNYGGFYVSRYEAGISDKLKDELVEQGYMEHQYITQDTTERFADGSYKPVSKVDSFCWNYIAWGGTLEEISSDEMAGSDDSNGAVKVAKSMYNNNFKTNVISGLCYGRQWEAIMNFIDENYYSNSYDEKSVIQNSSEIGNYYGILQSSGYNKTFFVKNISDLAGNLWEWTMEGYDTMYRVTRGGSYTSSSEIYSISSSKEYYPNDNSKEIGFRIMLVIK